MIEKDVMVAMPDGVRLACNVYRPDKTGRFPVILGMTPYGKVDTPGTAPTALSLQTHIQTMSTGSTRAGSASATKRYPCLPPSNTRTLPSGSQRDAVIIADQRGGFKSEGKRPTAFEGGDDLFHLVEWSASQTWSNGNVGMVGVSALAMNQYYVASRQPPSPHLKAIIPWEGMSDEYRGRIVLGRNPGNELHERVLKASIQALPPKKHPDEAAKFWPRASTLWRTNLCCRRTPTSRSSQFPPDLR